MKIIKILGDEIAREQYGAKAAWLNYLYCRKIRVPKAIFLPAISLEEYREMYENESWRKELFSFIKRELGEKRLAIRSSAIDEDGDVHSMAGLYKSILDIDVSYVFDAIQEVLESGRGKKVGVIVQEMVPAMVGGVAFSSNPLNARKDEMLIEMVNGKQSRLMEGVRQAENLVVKKSRIRFLPRYNAKIGKINLLKLIEIAIQIEKLYKQPMDIEWCISRKDKKLYLLQCRPVTGLLPQKNILTKIEKEFGNAIPAYLINNDKIRLRIDANRNRVFVPNAYLFVASCTTKEFPFDNVTIPRSQYCKGYSVVITSPKTIGGKVIRSFVGRKDIEIDDNAHVLRKCKYENLEECLKEFYAMAQKKYWACSIIIQEIFEPIYTGSLCKTNGKYVIEIGIGHFMSKGLMPMSCYIFDEYGKNVFSKEVLGDTYYNIVEGNVVKYVNKKKSIVSLRELDLKRIIMRFKYFVSEETIVEFGVLKDESRMPYLTDFTRSRSNIAIKMDEAQNGVLSNGCRMGKLVKLDRKDDVLNMHFYNNFKVWKKDLKKHIIFYAKSPSIEYSILLQRYPAENIGFVFEEGALLCHFAVLLREKGIPAITGVNSKSVCENCIYELKTNSKRKLQLVSFIEEMLAE